MGAYLSQPNTVKSSSNGGNQNMSYGFAAMQGWRVSMEVRWAKQIAGLDSAVIRCQYGVQLTSNQLARMLTKLLGSDYKK